VVSCAAAGRAWAGNDGLTAGTLHPSPVPRTVSQPPPPPPSKSSSGGVANKGGGELNGGAAGGGREYYVSDLPVDEKFTLARSVGEECIQDAELRLLFEKKPHPVVYDGFEPSGRMHIAQGVLRAINVNKLTRCGCVFKVCETSCEGSFFCASLWPLGPCCFGVYAGSMGGAPWVVLGGAPRNRQLHWGSGVCVSC
jgi:hypothetical protein